MFVIVDLKPLTCTDKVDKSLITLRPNFCHIVWKPKVTTFWLSCVSMHLSFVRCFIKSIYGIL